jgi:cell division protein FtsB
MLWTLAILIPIVAILSDTYIKAKKLELEKLYGKGKYKELEVLQKEVERLSQENTQLKERMQNIETIVTFPDWEMMQEAKRQSLLGEKDR